MTSQDVLDKGENLGLEIAILVLAPVKEEWEALNTTCVEISNADFLQFAGLVAVIRQQGVPGLSPSKRHFLLSFAWGRPDEVACNPNWTDNLPGFQEIKVDSTMTGRCLGSGLEIQTKMMNTNGFTATEAVALIGAHTIGHTRSIFGGFRPDPWVENGRDSFPGGPVFDNSFFQVLEGIPANNCSAFGASFLPFTSDFPDWFAMDPNSTNFLDTDVTLAFPSVGSYPDFHTIVNTFANSNTAFLNAFLQAYDKMSKLGVSVFSLGGALSANTDPCACQTNNRRRDRHRFLQQEIDDFIARIKMAREKAQAAIEVRQEERAEEIAELTTPDRQIDPATGEIVVLRSPESPSPAPTEEETAPLICFPGSSVVTLKSGRHKPIKDLSIGDLVMVENDSFEPIYSFGHHAPLAKGLFLKLGTTTGDHLHVSQNHMVEMADRSFVPACRVKIGDVLLKNGTVATQVSSIKTLHMEGVYAPFTPSGKIIVDNISASTFVAMIGDKNHSDVTFGGLVISQQWLAHSFEAPHRFFCYHLDMCPEIEMYDEHGLSSWIAMPFHTSLWWLTLEDGWLKRFLFMVLVVCLTLLTCVEVLVARYPRHLFSLMIVVGFASKLKQKAK